MAQHQVAVLLNIVVDVAVHARLGRADGHAVDFAAGADRKSAEPSIALAEHEVKLAIAAKAAGTR